MILKRLFEDEVINIERIVLREYRRLDLSQQEAHVLLAFFSIARKRRIFSSNALGKRLGEDQDVIGTHVESLYKKGFITLSLDKTKDGKSREIFDLDPTFRKIEALFETDEKERNRSKTESQVVETLERFEQGLGRLLRPLEIDTIRRWYDDELYQHDRIQKAIEDNEPRVSLKAVERHLTQTIPEEVEIDEEVESILDGLYKRIR
jgi:DNA replication protein